jgi:hypothetical protein
MTASIDKEKIFEKWKSILDPNIGQLDHWAPIQSDYVLGIDPALGTSSSEFPSLFPIVRRVAAKTIGLDLVNVQPISGNSREELERIKGEVTQENRDRAIDSLLEGGEFTPMKVEEHPDYNSGPKGQLFYLDYKYNSGTFSLGEDSDVDI